MMRTEVINCCFEESIKRLYMDSESNQHNLQLIDSFLLLDNIKYFRHIRTLNKSSIQYLCNIPLSKLMESVKNYYLKKDLNKLSNHLIIDAVLTEDLMNGYTAILIEKDYAIFKDSFLFDIEENYYKNLNVQNKQQIIQRLEDIIHLIYISIYSSSQLEICPEKSSVFHQEIRNEKISNEFNLSKNDLFYLQVLSIPGSAKELARTFLKSPRTIEKKSQKFYKKFGTTSKSKLHLISKILTSH